MLDRKKTERRRRRRRGLEIKEQRRETISAFLLQLC